MVWSAFYFAGTPSSPVSFRCNYVQLHHLEMPFSECEKAFLLNCIFLHKNLPHVNDITRGGSTQDELYFGWRPIWIAAVFSAWKLRSWSHSLLILSPFSSHKRSQIDVFDQKQILDSKEIQNIEVAALFTFLEYRDCPEYMHFYAYGSYSASHNVL